MWIKTASDSKASKGASVWFTAYGEKSKSRDIELTADKELFAPNSKDEFDVRCIYVCIILNNC